MTDPIPRDRQSIDDRKCIVALAVIVRKLAGVLQSLPDWGPMKVPPEELAAIVRVAKEVEKVANGALAHPAPEV